MTRLFSYTVAIDDGSAPNPFNGMCSLAICKPAIRRVAKEGDWVAGLGSKTAPSGDLSGRLVYAMRIENTLSFQEYDEKALKRWPHRIPNITSMALQDRLGDCIYDYSHGTVRQRLGIHGPGNIETDLGGERVLLSRHFYYFGSRAIALPTSLLGICHQWPGHRSEKNKPFVDEFVTWIDSGNFTVGQLYGWPDFVVNWKDGVACNVCSARQQDAESDERCNV